MAPFINQVFKAFKVWVIYYIYFVKKLILLLLFIPFLSYGQTGIYHSDGVLTVKVPTTIDVLLGYPTADELESDAVDNYNKGTEILKYLNELSDNEKIKAIEQAIDLYIRAINFDSKFVQAYDNLGKAYRMLGKYELAIKSYKISIEIFPNGPSAHQNLAIVYENQNNWNKAIKEYKIVIDLTPQNPEGYYGLANNYKKTSELDLALSNALSALSLYEQNPPNYIGDSYGQVGLIYYDMGNKSKAKTYIQIAKEKYILNNFDDYFYATFPKSILEELSIE